MKIRLFGRIIIIPKWIKYSIIAILVLVLGICGYFIQKARSADEITLIETNTPNITEQPNETLSSSDIQPTAVPEMITVYIIGEIVKKDVYEIPVGSILNDLVYIAGGFTENADTDSINLAYTLKNGMMIRIPSKNDTDKTWIVDGGSSGSSVSEQGTILVNINTATVSELCTLPGVGESTALKIISYRTENGPFNDISEIMNVNGIKESRYSVIKNYITVG